MIIVREFGANLIVLANDNLVCVNVQDGTCKNIKIPQPPVERNLSQSLQEVLKPENLKGTSLCTSANGAYLAVSFQNRQLIVFKSGFETVMNRLTKRAASRVIFTKDSGGILVADKTGDVYLYEIDKDEPTLLLGHLSMVLDVAVSDCGRFVVTCDRDEKIRVSCYPNAYNIVSYCLGHNEFVTNIAFCLDTLLSASGDGTIRGWDFIKGRQVFALNTNDYVIDRSIIERFCNEMDDERVDVSAVPVLDMQIHNNIVAVTLLDLNGVQLYKVERLEVKFLKTVTFKSKLIAFNLSSRLFMITQEQLLVYDIDKFQIVNVSFEEFDKLIGTFQSVDCSISTLYKRKYDNVQEYLAKKKLRLENK